MNLAFKPLLSFMALKRIVMYAFVGLSLTACVTDTPVAGPIAAVGFQHLKPLRLVVAQVSVGSEYKSPMKAPNAEFRFSTPPERALFDWAKTRLVAVGGKDHPAQATFVIEDASVIETKLKKSQGFKGMFTYEPTSRYDARVVGRLEIKDQKTGAQGQVRVVSSRSAEVRENATLAEREQIWMELVESLLADFNTQMDVQIKTYLGQWLDAPAL